MAANQIDDTSLPHDWLDSFLPFYPQRMPTIRSNMNSEQTPVTKTVELPETEMSDVTSTQPPQIDNLLNTLLVEAAPLAFLESLVPGNAFASMNYTASALITSLELPVIPPSISTALIKELRTGQRTLDTSILSDLTLRANDNATATEECASNIVKYKEHLALQQREIPPLLAEISSLTAKLVATFPDGEEAANLVFQYTQALTKLSFDLTHIIETNPGLLLIATSLLHTPASSS